MRGTHVRGFAYRNPINEDGEIGQQAHYFYCNQIGIPREMTDDEGKLVWGLVRLWQTEERDEHNRNGSPTLPIGKHPCPHWHVATAKMDRNIIQKRNNGNGTFSWKYYKDNVTVQHRK